MYLFVCFAVFARWWDISVTQWKNVTALRRNGIMRRHHQPVNVQPSVCGVYKHHSLGVNVQPSTTASECKLYIGTLHLHGAKHTHATHRDVLEKRNGAKEAIWMHSSGEHVVAAAGGETVVFCGCRA